MSPNAVRRVLNGILAAAIAAGSLSACATPERKAQAWREQEVGALRDLVNRVHDKARVSEDAPYIVAEMSNIEFMRSFGKQNCGFDLAERAVSHEARARCDSIYAKAMLERLGARYYAADQSAVAKRCERERLACRDPQILELWIREAHNEGVERSRREKLPRLDEWVAGRISNDELQAALRVPAAAMGDVPAARAPAEAASVR